MYDGGVRHILTRHEQGAALAAIGHARSTGQVGVCLATSGPGATNLITGLADALLDSVPVVAITGQVASPLIGTDAFQEVDVLGLSLACTKHSYLVTDIADLPRVLNEAFAVAQSGRPGPVLVDIAKDVQLATLAQDAGLGSPDRPNSIECLPDVVQQEADEPQLARKVRSARQMILEAQRPVLYIGGGVVSAGATSELRALIEHSQIPSTTTVKALGAVPATAPLHLGMLGMHGTKAANLIVQQSDLLICVGARFDDRVTGKVPTFAPEAKVIHLDVDPAEIGKIRHAEVALIGDLRTLLPALIVRPDVDDWRAHVRALSAELGWRYDHPGDGIYAPALLHELAERTQPRTVVTTDIGQHQMWACQHMAVDHPTDFVTSGGLGTMGFGLPAAIGAQVARPADTVVCISGDGSIMMNIQELATLGRYGLPVKIVLLDNQRLGMVRQWQDLFFDGRHSETVLDDNPDFVALAAAFGIPGRHITTKSEVTPALGELLDAPGAFLLHVSIDAEENLWPLVPPGASNDQMLENVR
ncbi:acetolactate synthase 2 catalytic subunit [Nocardioides sp.]|uniref:acetolactate synthase 2 catalytic subunit n=1 Tax=Nocardioides sp. TaxID=35761 RepID=UPI003219C7F9